MVARVEQLPVSSHGRPLAWPADRCGKKCHVTQGTQWGRVSQVDCRPRSFQSCYRIWRRAATRLFSVKGPEIIRNLLCRRQHCSETVSGFLTELHALAKHTSLARFTAEGKNVEDYIVGALLALSDKSPAIQQRLLREDDITLQKLLQHRSHCWNSQSWPKTVVVRQNWRHRGRQPSRSCLPFSVCLRCGRQGRTTRKQSMSGTKEPMQQLRKRGHFARICQSSKVTEPFSNQIATVCFSDTVNDLPDKGICVLAAAHGSTKCFSAFTLGLMFCASFWASYRYTYYTRH